MITAHLTDGRFIIGIDARNVELLKEGKPLMIQLRAYGGQDTVLLMYGETLDDVTRELAKHFDLPPHAFQP